MKNLSQTSGGLPFNIIILHALSIALPNRDLYYGYKQEDCAGSRLHSADASAQTDYNAIKPHGGPIRLKLKSEAYSNPYSKIARIYSLFQKIGNGRNHRRILGMKPRFIKGFMLCGARLSTRPADTVV